MESGTVEHLFYWYNRQHNGWNRRILPKTLHPSLWRCKLLIISTMTEWRVVLTLHHPSLPFTEFWLAFPRWRIAESVLIDLRNLRQNQQELLIWRWKSVKGGEGWWRVVKGCDNPSPIQPIDTVIFTSKKWRVKGSPQTCVFSVRLSSEAFRCSSEGFWCSSEAFWRTSEDFGQRLERRIKN